MTNILQVSAAPHPLALAHLWQGPADSPLRQKHEVSTNQYRKSTRTENTNNIIIDERFFRNDNVQATAVTDQNWSIEPQLLEHIYRYVVSFLNYNYFFHPAIRKVG